MAYTTKKSDSVNGGVKQPAWWIQITIVSITVIAVAITTFLGINTYNKTRQTVLEQFNQNQLILARSAAAGIETYFSEVKASLVSATKVDAIKNMTNDCLEYMQNMYLGFIPRTSIRRLDENGVLRFIYPSDDWRGRLTGRNYGGEKYFKDAQKKGGVVLSGITINEIGEKRIRMSMPVYVPATRESGEKKFTGVLVVSFDLKAIASIFISPIRSGKTGYSWLMDQNGYFLAHNVDTFVGQDAFHIREQYDPELSYESINEIQQKVMVGGEGIGRYFSGWHRGKKGRIEKLIAYSPIHVIDQIWSAAVVAPVNEVDEIIREGGSHALNTFAFIILFFILAGTFSFLSVYRWSSLLRSEVRKRTKKLRETTDYLNNLIRCANAPVVVLDHHGEVTIFNDVFERMSGRTEEEMIGKSLDVLFPDTSRVDSMKRLKQAQSEGKDLYAQEMAIRHRDGKLHVVLWNSANIYSDTGNGLIATIIHGEDVTERKQVEEALRESEKRYRNVLETQGDLICRYTPDWHLTFVNEPYCRFTGKQRGELIGESFMPFIPEEQREKVKEYHAQLMDPKIEEVRHEHQAYDIKGGLRWHQWVNRAIFDDHGTLVEYQSVGRDITELKETEEALQQSEVQYRALFEGAPDPIFLTDIKTGILIDVNLPASQLIMMPRDKMIGMNHLQLYPEFEREEVKARFSEIKGEDVRRRAELLVQRSDGKLVPVEILGNVITIGSKDVVQGIFRDITERKKAEQRLRENEERFRKIFEGGALGMAFLNLEYKFERVNAKLCAMLGYEEAELTDLTFIDITHPDYIEENLQQMAQLLHGNIPYYKAEKRYIRKDREYRWGSVTASIIYDENNKPLYLIAMIEDITEQKRAEEEKMHLKAQLLHAQKMEALGTLVAGVAHEINNPVNKIIFNVPLLQKVWTDIMPVLEEQEKKDPARKYGGLTCDFLRENLPQLISDMEMAANRVAITVNNLKNFTKQSSITDKAPMEINTAVENALRLIETTLRKSNIMLELKLAKKSPEIEGNLQSIEQIVMNIAINAIQSIDHNNGRIIISTRLKRKGGKAVITIADNGSGVDPSIIDKLFDPFVTTRQADGGTGLGLPITYNLVEAHAGKITFASKEGKGTTFSVTFPALRA
ncbi:MAG TPA: PAS domain S-box protein [Desulfobacteraceae bacterium]|nr:PAS domain S-box protein [Desulfobacteraceae bacterium]